MKTSSNELKYLQIFEDIFKDIFIWIEDILNLYLQINKDIFIEYNISIVLLKIHFFVSLNHLKISLIHLKIVIISTI